MTDVATADTALTNDQAVERLMAKAAPEPVEATPAPVEAAPEPVETQTPSEAPSGAEETPSEPVEVNAEGEDAETVEAAQPSIDAPHFWTAEEKEAFAKLPPELQNVVLKKAKDGEAVVSKAQMTASEAAKAAETARVAADAKVAETTALIARVNEVLPKAEAAARSKWDGIDWVRWARENPGDYTAGKAEYDADMLVIQQLKAVKDDADKKAETDRANAETARRQEWANSEAAILAKQIPDLADPAKSKPLTDRIIAYAKAQGYTDQEIGNASAKEWVLAHRAMLADEAKSSLTTPKPTPTPTTPKPAVRPGGAQTRSQATSAEAAKGALAKSGKTDDAVALLLARMKG